ncbi:MAG: hypothetical protein U0572_08215 [Phycisphaerales bacterium]
MLSIQGQRNIITGKNVAGSVTANLFDVTVTEALDVILKALDLRYEEAGNFIYVYTREEWEQMQLARRKRESRRFTLEYISGKDANEFVAPLLSDTGKIAMLGTVERGMLPDTSNAGEDSWAFQSMLVVNDYPENLQAIADLLTEVDTPPAQVCVDSTIVSTRVNEDNAFGVDFTIIANSAFTDFVNPLGAVANLIVGNNTPGAKASDKLGFQPADNSAIGVGSTVGQTQGPGGLKVGVITDNVSVFMRVLDEVTDAVILARPRVLALNRQRAQILVGEKVGYISTTQTETTTTQTVQYLDTGIKLIFRPFISRDGSIRMELAPSVSEAVLRQVTSNVGGGVVIPDEKTNQVTTNVRVKDGQTMVIGGLFQEKTTIQRRQVPILGDIPIVNAAFTGQDDEIIRTEIIFLITPTIMHDALAAMWGKQGTEFAEAVRVGAREGTLPFSRERLSVAQNQKAYEALTAGNTELALHHTEASLRLNPIQPEMIRLRAELDKSQPSITFERDMMKRIMEQRTATQVDKPTQSMGVVPASDPLAPAATSSQANATTEAQPQADIEAEFAQASEEWSAMGMELFNAVASEPTQAEQTTEPYAGHCADGSEKPLTGEVAAAATTPTPAPVTSTTNETAPKPFDPNAAIAAVSIDPNGSSSDLEPPIDMNLDPTRPVEATEPTTQQQAPTYFVEVFANNAFLRPWMTLFQRGVQSNSGAYATVTHEPQSTEQNEK